MSMSGKSCRANDKRIHSVYNNANAKEDTLSAKLPSAQSHCFSKQRPGSIFGLQKNGYGEGYIVQKQKPPSSYRRPVINHKNSFSDFVEQISELRNMTALSVRQLFGKRLLVEAKEAGIAFVVVWIFDHQTLIRLNLSLKFLASSKRVSNPDWTTKTRQACLQM